MRTENMAQIMSMTKSRINCVQLKVQVLQKIE